MDSHRNLSHAGVISEAATAEPVQRTRRKAQRCQSLGAMAGPHHRNRTRDCESAQTARTDALRRQRLRTCSRVEFTNCRRSATNSRHDEMRVQLWSTYVKTRAGYLQAAEERSPNLELRT